LKPAHTKLEKKCFSLPLQKRLTNWGRFETCPYQIKKKNVFQPRTIKKRRKTLFFAILMRILGSKERIEGATSGS